MSYQPFAFGHCLPAVKDPLIWICAVCQFPVVCQNQNFQLKAVSEHVVNCAPAGTV
jgi:hypothetical protein